MCDKILDFTAIQRILPHRYPALLVDRAVIENQNRCVGIKNLSINEEFFQGHFPGHPIFPGVLQVEAMGQVAEIAVGAKLAPKANERVYIKSVSGVKFRRPNNPGDRMLIEVDVNDIENREASVKAVTKNQAGVTCQAKLVMAVQEKTTPSAMPLPYGEFDKTEDSLMDVNEIMSLIPHRYPFLLVDYIVKCEDETVTAVKNVTGNEPFCQGHLPGYPVLPGAIQSEIVAQAGCVLMLSQEHNKGKIAYFMSIIKAEYIHPIVPGDQLVIEVTLPSGGSTKFGKGIGTIRVDGRVVSKTEMSFALIDP